jgi:NAD(P)-dependent dehydrogenase (short-subunit alcohol dehydrogenase family)
MAALLNKTALVTGASRGIGRATASALAAAGAHVLVHYGRSAQDAESLVADIRSKEGRADAIQADLGTPDGATLLAKEVRSIVGERLDVLVSNAGISKAATIKDHTVEDFDNLFATNVRSPFFLVQQLLPVLGEGSNVIVISSKEAQSRVYMFDINVNAGCFGICELFPTHNPFPLLYKSHVWCRAAFGHFLDGAELGFIAGNVLAQRAKNPLRMTRADDHAFKQLALLPVGKYVDKVERKLLEIMVNHHQVAVLAL